MTQLRPRRPQGVLVAACLMVAGCSEDRATPDRGAGPPAVAGFDLLPLPADRAAECLKFARATPEIACPAVFPRPSGHETGNWVVKPARTAWGRQNWNGIDLTFLPTFKGEDRQVPTPVHYSLAAFGRHEDQGYYGALLERRGRPATFAGRRGTYVRAPGDQPCCNHDLFSWMQGGTRYVASLHRIGPQTEPLFEALMRFSSRTSSSPAAARAFGGGR